MRDSNSAAAAAAAAAAAVVVVAAAVAQQRSSDHEWTISQAANLSSAPAASDAVQRRKAPDKKVNLCLNGWLRQESAAESKQRGSSNSFSVGGRMRSQVREFMSSRGSSRRVLESAATP